MFYFNKMDEVAKTELRNTENINESLLNRLAAESLGRLLSKE